MTSLDIKHRGKLGPKYYKPFQVLACIGNIAHCLQLPPGAKLHNVFHIGLLKTYCGAPPE
jgi:hypothetical protein